MAGVFNVPGVPSLSSYAAGGLTLLNSDFSGSALVDAAAQATLQWGIFVNGLPVILPTTSLTSALKPLSIVNGLFSSFVDTPVIFPVVASFVDVEYKQDWPISDYPVEEGGFQTYDKVELPFTLRVRVAASGGAADLQSFLTVIQNMAGDVFNQYDVVTPYQVYTSLSCSHYDYSRSATHGVSLLVVDLWFIEIRVTVSAISLQNTLNPGFAGQQNIGTVQAVTPGTNVTGAFNAGNMPY